MNSGVTNIDDLSFIVVDDHMLMRKVLTQYLNDLGYTKIDTAINGKDALDKIGAKSLIEQPYDVAFIDMKMPIMDGMELLRICRENRSLDSTAFVMLTGECEKQKVIEAIHSGVTSYIVKPVSQHDLAEKMKTITKWIKEQRDTNV